LGLPSRRAEHIADRAFALDRPDGCQAALSREVEAPDPRPADALLQAPIAWDASACAHPDATADAVHRELRLTWADGAERWADQARDVRVRDAM